MPARLLKETLQGGRLTTRLALWGLRRRGWIRREGMAWSLAGDGRRVAEGIVRNHRLWELYLARNLHRPGQDLHEPAHRLEHLDADTLGPRLSEHLGHPTEDPHGRRIPGSTGPASD